MKLVELKQKHPEAAKKFLEMIEDSSMDPNDPADDINEFVFEEKNGFIKGVGPLDEQQGIPPVWFIPKPTELESEPYWTPDPKDYESEMINNAGFEYDWTDYALESLQSLMPEDELN